MTTLIDVAIAVFVLLFLMLGNWRVVTWLAEWL